MLFRSAYGRLPKLSMSKSAPNGNAAVAPSQRTVYFGRRHGTLQTPVHQFSDLHQGWRTEGPAVIEQQFSTVLILPGHMASLDAYGNILIEVPQ